MLKDYKGTHDGPMHYTVVLSPPDFVEAMLYAGFGPGLARRLCFIDEPANRMRECAETLWRDGADPRSTLELVWGQWPGDTREARTKVAIIAAVVPEAI